MTLFLMIVMYGLHFCHTAIQVQDNPYTMYLYGLHTCWYYSIAEDVLAHPISRLCLPIANTSIILIITCLDFGIDHENLYHTIAFLVIYSLRNVRVYQAAETATALPAVTQPSGLRTLRSLEERHILTYNVLQKIPVGVIRFDFNMALIQSNSTARRLFKSLPGIELSNAEVYDIFGKISSLKIRQDLADKQLLDSWVEQLASAYGYLTPRRRSPVKTFAENAHNISIQSLLNHNDVTREMREQSETVNTTHVTLADLLHLLTAEDGKRLKELFGAGYPADTDEGIVIDGRFKNEEREVLFELTISPVLGAYDDEPQIIMTFKDITIRELLSVAESNSTFKENLFGSLSHELRTPMNGTISALESAMTDSGVSLRVRESYILPAFRSSMLLMNIINDLLDLSLLQLKSLEFTFELFDLEQLIVQCIDLVKANAIPKKISLTLHSQNQGLNYRINSDKTRISQIITNLLTNALKFTQTGGEIVVKIDRSDLSSSALKVSVKDSGIGMSSDDVCRLRRSFELWETVDKTSLHSSGAGIGLFISNQLTRNLSPNESGLEVVSIQGMGSTFYFEIADQHTRRSSSSASKLNSPGLSKLKGDGYLKFNELDGKQLNFNEKDSNERKLGRTSTVNRKQSIDLHHFVERQSVNSKTVPPRQRKASAPLEAIVDISDEDHNSLASEQVLSLDKSLPKSLICDGIMMLQMAVGNIKYKKMCCNDILVVDDDGLNLLALGGMLRNFGYQSDTACDGREAVEKFKARVAAPCPQNCHNYRLIFMDINMPRKNGLDATQLIRDFEKVNSLSPVVIIACTAHTHQPVEYYQERGMDDCFYKPMKPSLLKKVLFSNGYPIFNHSRKPSCWSIEAS